MPCEPRSPARRSNRARPRCGGTHRSCRSRRPRSLVSRPGSRRSFAAPRLASALGVGRLFLKLDTANPTHSFKDRVVAVAAAKALELGCETLSCSSTGNLANAVAARAAAEGIEAVVFCPADLEPEKLAATAVYGATIYAVDGSYDDCSRLSVELSFELDWAFVNVGLRSYYAEGSKTLAFEIAEQLGWQLPTAVVAPIASGALFSKVRPGVHRAPAPRSRRRGATSAVRRAGRRVRASRRPRSPRIARSRRSGPTPSRARSRSAAPRTATLRSRPPGLPAARSMPSPRTRSARTWRSSPRRAVSSVRPPPA